MGGNENARLGTHTILTLLQIDCWKNSYMRTIIGIEDFVTYIPYIRTIENSLIKMKNSKII